MRGEELCTRAHVFFFTHLLCAFGLGSLCCIGYKGSNEKEERGRARRRIAKKSARFFFHSPAVRFCAGESLRCIGSKGRNEKEQRGAARRKFAKKSAPFFSLTCCALFSWEEHALYKVQGKV